jgi:hypothetical protein
MEEAAHDVSAWLSGVARDLHDPSLVQSQVDPVSTYPARVLQRDGQSRRRADIPSAIHHGAHVREGGDHIAVGHKQLIIGSRAGGSQGGEGSALVGDALDELDRRWQPMQRPAHALPAMPDHDDEPVRACGDQALGQPSHSRPVGDSGSALIPHLAVRPELRPEPRCQYDALQVSAPLPSVANTVPAFVRWRRAPCLAQLRTAHGGGATPCGDRTIQMGLGQGSGIT